MQKHETEVTIQPFPLLKVKLKRLNDQYYDAVWNCDLHGAYKIKLKIDAIIKSIENGEKYDVPF